MLIDPVSELQTRTSFHMRELLLIIKFRVRILFSSLSFAAALFMDQVGILEDVKSQIIIFLFIFAFNFARPILRLDCRHFASIHELFTKILSAQHIDHFFFPSLLQSFRHFFWTVLLNPANKITNRASMQETIVLNIQRFKGRITQIVTNKSLHIHSFGPQLAGYFLPHAIGEQYRLGLVSIQKRVQICEIVFLLGISLEFFKHKVVRSKNQLKNNNYISKSYSKNIHIIPNFTPDKIANQFVMIGTILIYLRYKLIKQFQQLMQHLQIPIKTQDSINRTMTMMPILPPSATELHKVIKNLEKIIGEEREKREAAEQKLEEYKLRSLKRQQELNGLIYKLKKSNTSLRDENPEISKLFNTIWSNFDLFNRKSIEMMEEKCQDTIGLMDRKIKSIVSTYQDELELNSKKSNVNVQGIMDDIRKVYLVAAKIQQKNIEMAQQVKRLQFESNVLKQQKLLAIEDAVNRKRKITSLQQQNKKLSQQLSKIKMKYEHEHGHNSQKNPQKRRNSNPSIVAKEPIPTYNHSKKLEFRGVQAGTEKTLMKHKSQFYCFGALMDNHNMRVETLQYFKDNNQALMNSTISYTPKSHKNQTSTTQGIKNTSIYLTRNSKLTKRSSQSTSRSMRQKSTIKLTENEAEPQPCTCPQSHQSHQSKQKQYYYISTIQNLQKSLKRQKQRCHSLGTTVTQIASKSKQINQALQQILKEEEQGENRLEILIKSEKLFQILKMLKQRLSMLEKPTVNCGWGDSLGDL